MSMPESDTIAAIATAPGLGGISIVRLSGPKSLAIADILFRGAPPPPSQRATFTFAPGHVVEADGAVIDEALLLVFRAPHSFTREDVVEVQGHGGPAITRRVLRRVLEAGARLAEPGEFTRRAFMNGRIDLVQAEAVLDLIRARTDRAAAAAVDQLEGGLTRRFTRLYEALLVLAANLETTLDFSDQELPPNLLDGLLARVVEQEEEIDAMLRTWNEGHLLRDGATVVIAGRPNVGKSTLLNALLGRDRAIVSDKPGTTRDTIEEHLVLEGIAVNVVDTAGLRKTACDIEREGIRRTENRLRQADLTIYVLDASQGLEPEDIARMSALDPARSIVVSNKMDLPGAQSIHPGALPISLKSGTHLDKLRLMLVEKLGGGAVASIQHAVISERHRVLLETAMVNVREAGTLMKAGQDLSIASQSLRTAISAIAQILGREVHEDLLDNIFSRFCIGK
jgi:tRNA modification GTPase